jgi:preflagellin peptidase FlaK
MEILYPLVISAIAVLVTLTYASYLDIRDRRVPFVYWLPMLGIGIICVVYLLWQTTADLSLITGILPLFCVFCMRITWIAGGERTPQA